MLDSLNCGRFYWGKRDTWESIAHYLEVIPDEKTSPQITPQLKAYAISHKKDNENDMLQKDKFKVPDSTPNNAISQEDLIRILSSYNTSNSFFSARLTPELDKLKEMSASRTYCTRDDIEWAITQAQSSWGSRMHRFEIFNSLEAHPEDKTGTSQIIRQLERHFSTAGTHSLSNSPACLWEATAEYKDTQPSAPSQEAVAIAKAVVLPPGTDTAKGPHG